MKKILEILRRSSYPLVGALIIAIVFSACSKKDSGNQRTPTAGLMAFNLAADKDAVGFTLSGNNLTTQPLGYTSYTGSYLPVYIGSREVKSYDFRLGTPMATSTQTFADSLFYSLFAVGYNGSYKNIVVNDSLRSLVATPGQAFVRYINAIADSSASPVVTIASNDGNVVNNPAPFGSVSAFTKISAGNIVINVNNSDKISANRTIAVDEKKVYTILLVGNPAATDSTKKVQIKFIQNGTITP